MITYEQLCELNRIAQRYSVQVEEDLYLVTTRAYFSRRGPYRLHQPFVSNLGMSGQIALVAMLTSRPTPVGGEEVSFDYAMTDGSPYDEFECAFGLGFAKP